MNIKQTLRKITLALGLAASGTAMAAGGDVYEIRPCNAEGVAVAHPVASIDLPMGAGESLYFNMRLWNHFDNTTGKYLKWALVHTGVNAPDVDWAVNPLQIGIYVSGQLQCATLVKTDATKDAFTDFIFKYVTRPGDFALPIRLATATGPAGDSSATGSYYLEPLSAAVWSIREAIQVDGSVSYGAAAELTYGNPTVPVAAPESDGRLQDYSLEKSGFYLQTIDFDDNWDVGTKGTPGAVWRSVHQGSTTMDGNGIPAKLVAPSAPVEQVTLYVWSDDESVVKVKGGTETDLWLDADGNSKVTTSVGKITFAGGQMSADFQIEGVTKDLTAHLILSAWNNYTYSAGTSERIVDYVSVPVKCTDPLPPTVIVSCDRSTAVADGDYLLYKAVLSVNVSEPCPAPFTVTVTPKFEENDSEDNLAGVNWSEYVRFSTAQDEVATLPPAAAPTVTIPANSTGKQTIYVFTLRGDSHSTGVGHQLKFIPTVDEAEAAAAGIVNYQEGACWITAANPLITTPGPDAEISAISGDDQVLTIAVDDTYADMSDLESGYKVFIKYRASDAWKELPDTYGVGESGVLYKLNAGGTLSADLPVINYPASGELVSSIYVVAPVSGKKSAEVSFKAHVAEARTSHVETTDGKDDVYDEGDRMKIKITLSEKNDTDATIYAFLKASDNAEAGMFGGMTRKFVICGDTDLTTTKGLVINKNNDTVEGSILLQDGADVEQGGLDLQFEVVLCTTPQYSDATRIAGYDSDYLNIIVNNLEPVIKRIEMNNSPSETDGYTFPNKVPKGMARTFQAIVSDKGSYDLESGFQARWTVALNNNPIGDPVTITANPLSDEGKFNYTFNQAGTWSVKLQVKDKDMADWSETTYTVFVEVLSNPIVEVKGPSDVNETDTTADIQVQLSYFDNLFAESLRVKVTVEEYSPGRTNPGSLRLDPQYKSSVAGEDNVYYIELSDDSPFSIAIDPESLDGTDVSSVYGFRIKAEVVSDTVLPTSGTAANEYYKPQEMRLRVNNVDPVCTVSPLENTNRWIVAGGLATTHAIKWQVRSDVAADFEGGIKVTFNGCENAAEGSTVVHEATSGTFIPNFGSMQGDVDVTLTIEDKDGGYLSWTWQFTVTPSKFLHTQATGPSGGNTSSGLSQRYVAAKGIGKGHVWVKDATFVSADDFLLSWNCSKELTRLVYGWGYKFVGGTPQTDNGSLNGGRDVAIDGAGKASPGVAIGAPYVYADATGRDSFLYTWLYTTIGEQGGVTSTLLGNTISPEKVEMADAYGIVPLPTEQTQDGSYADTYVEAIFSKEWRPLDNCGDINQDGIPDRVVQRYGMGVYDTSAGQISGNDLADLSAYNEDGDFLPAPSTKGNALIPNIASSWQTVGEPFYAFYEVRGFGKGLNAGYPNADGTVEVDYTTSEQRAWMLFKGFMDEEALKGMSDADATALFETLKEEAANDLVSGVWTPERPTDPTKEDTDSDGLPDGYEYWFWYGAKVGYLDGANWAGLMHGKRLNLDDIEVFEDIAPEEICQAFDPLNNSTVEDPDEDLSFSRGNILERDFDNDGLFDLEEFAMGTNPVNCDTDGDGLPDGWEVMWGLNPLSDKKPDGAGDNPDGDCMAYATELCVFDGFPMPGTTLVKVQNLDEDGNPIVDEIGVQVFDFYIMQEVAFAGDIVPGDTIHACYIGRAAEVETLLRTVGGETIPKMVAPHADIWLEKADSVEVDAFYPLTLIHDQVFNYFGFDPRTAWSDGHNHGYVSKRWCPVCNTTDLNIAKALDAGLVTNTKPYTTKDEYLYGKYAGIRGDGGVLKKLAASCTNPNVVFEDKTYGDSATSFSSAQHGADTSGDGVPDGWCIYVGGDPITKNPIPWGQMNGDIDTLVNAAEFAGTDTCELYADCETIAANAPTQGWVNKFFPTNPYDADTDGDGVTDDMEGKDWVGVFYAGNKSWLPAGFTFIYDSGIADDGKMLCVRGGGMNPCSSDTDFDGLPDAWEMEFAGIVVSPAGTPVDTHNDDEMYTDALKVCDGFGTGDFKPTGNYIMGGMDATDGYDASMSLLKDDVTGTIRDRDFDRDGLDNFQEYLVQAVRLWRYDDAETPLMGRSIVWTGDPETTYLTDELAGKSGYLQMNMLSGEAMLEKVKASPLGEVVDIEDNHYLAGSTAVVEVPKRNIDGTLVRDDDGMLVYEEVERTVAPLQAYDYKALGYMAPTDSAWDPMNQCGIALGATYGFGYMRRPSTMIGYQDGLGPIREYGLTYVSTDPRRWDTDADGMDDYWEIFHGLNPLLGSEDVIAASYAVAETPIADEHDNNVWGGLGHVYPNLKTKGYDPVLRPWRMGLPNADPDGDGLRNVDESIAGNMTSPTTYHTDPTPLWMTDISSKMSYVWQYYQLVQSHEDGPDLTLYPWVWTNDLGIGSGEGADLNMLAAFGHSIASIFSYEQTEGYDSDGDFRADAQEVVKTTMSISDPLNSSDPDRRAALYLPGSDACASSFIEGHLPVVDAYDVFRQFTVECWVKPEEQGREQTIFERGFAYPSSNLENKNKQWRANFRVAINAAGNVYGMFDNDNAVESGSAGFSSQQVTGGVLPLNEWSHVAMTFDGHNLTLYVNGQIKTSVVTGLIPANGINSIIQEPADTNLYPMAKYETVPGANTIGARRAPTALELDPDGGFDQFRDFFKGYVSEVRFWDGARSQTEIRTNYRVRMTPEEVAANREEVYKVWAEKGTRNDVDGKEKLPPQLMCLFNFLQLPAAVEPTDVAKTPSGFFHVLENVDVDPAKVEIGWWTAMDMKSTVYTDYHVVPWVQNAVSRLPMFDDSFQDSMYWSTPYAGNTPAQSNGVDDYGIPNGGNPYKNRYYKAEADWHYWRLSRLAEYFETAEEHAKRYEFQMRSEFVGLDDLLPLGGAYAKIDAEYWDKQGASTAWSDTGDDADGDGLPDWWEALQGGDIAPDDMVEYNGQMMPAWEAYMRDLAAGMQPSGTVDGAYASRADGDNDGLVDWWQDIYSLKDGANGDEDGDGLANYVEYLLAEVFKIAPFDPTDAFSQNEFASDYFFRVGKSYVGEIFTDHDRIDDRWEDKFANEYASRYLYDAMADADGDGWSNYAEFQAGTDPTKLASLGIDAVQMTEYPVPTIETHVTYEGTQSVGDMPIVVQAWRDSTLQTIPDAVWTIGGGQTQIYENGNSNTVTGLKYVGMNPNKQMLLHLSPGSVVSGSFKMEFKDLNWMLVNMTTGQAYASDPATAVWQGFVIDRQRTDDADHGDIIYQITDEVIGEIDYVTGAVTIDFGLLPEYAGIDGDVSAAAAGGGVGATAFVSIYTLPSSYIRINWNSQPITGGSTVLYYLADADQRTQENNSLGHIKEGRNTFVAFYDLDGDGKYSAGEPFGIAPNVDVGWNYAKVNIELTDTTPITARFSVSSESQGGDGETGATEATNDRTVLYGTEGGNFDVSNIIAGHTSGGMFERVRVVRTLINGQPLSNFGVPERVVLDKMVNVVNAPFLTEADFIRDGNLDIDWANFADDLARGNANAVGADITNVSYRVVLGNGDVTSATTNNLLPLVFNRWYDTPAVYSNDATPICIGPGIVTSAAPTFKWTIPGGLNSYTAFEIMVTGDSGTVWTSGYQPMPPRIKDATYGWRYEWTAPLFADSVTPDGTRVFENNKNYRWSITLANARYKNSENWSARTGFRMNVLTNATDYGAIDVAVRYFGSDAVAKSGRIRVQAFKTPDFSAQPVGEGYVTSLDAIADGENALVANARIIGLEAGTYYVRAFIDTQKDGICQNWESWGFACDRDIRGAAIYTPKAIKVGPKYGQSDVVSVFIDDSDTDQDNLPDAWEWTQKGNLTALNVGNLDQNLTGGIAVKKELTDALSGSGSLTTGLAVMLSSSLNSPYVAAMVMGVDVSGASTPAQASSAVVSAVSKAEVSAEPKSVKFTSITLDPTDSTVKLGVETSAVGSSSVDPALTAIYEFETSGSLTVTCRLWKKDTLAATKWTEVTSARRKVEVGENDSLITLNLGSDVDLSNGFFKVTLEK